MLGIIVNGNAAGPLSNGHREVNWDGGRTDIVATTQSPNPFDGFKVTRGALFTTPDGTGFVQAPPSAGAMEAFPFGILSPDARIARVRITAGN